MYLTDSKIYTFVFFTLLALYQPSAVACDQSEYRQFDFWLGNWNVFTTDGKLAGENRISLDLKGCILREQYKTSKGFQGESFNTYDQVHNKWHQTWVDNSGLLLLLSGNLEGRAMVLKSQKLATGKDVLQHKITWTPNKDGSVRQHWQTQKNNESWSTVFDGIYRKQLN